MSAPNKINLDSVATFTNDTTAVAVVNDNNALITTAFNNTLSRDGTTPNQMVANLDMNSNRILNLPVPAYPTDPIRLIDNMLGIVGPTGPTGPAGPPGIGSWYDVKVYGAIGNYTADDSVACQNAVNAAVAAGGGIVYFPAGHYRCSAGLIIHNATIYHGIYLMGAGRAATFLSTGNVDVPILDINGSSRLNISDMSIEGKGGAQNVVDVSLTQPTTPALKLVNVSGGYISNLQISGGSNCIYSSGSGEVVFDTISASWSYGNALLYQTTSSNYFNRCHFDQPTPLINANTPAPGTVFSNWAANTAHSVGDIVINVSVSPNWYMQCVAVTGDSKTGSGSAPTLHNYQVAVTDHNVTWMFASPVNLVGVLLDSGCYQNFFMYTDLIGLFHTCFLLEDTLSTGGPQNTFIYGATPGLYVNNAFWLYKGLGIQITDCQIDYSFGTTSVGINVDPNWSGRTIIKGNTIGIGGGGEYGIYIGSGPTGTTVADNSVEGHTVGVVADTGASYYSIMGNNLAGNTKAIQINSGNTKYMVVGNMVSGSTTGITDASGVGYIPGINTAVTTGNM